MLFVLPERPSIRSIRPKPRRGLSLMLLPPLVTLNPERMLEASARPNMSGGLGGVANGAESSELSSELMLARDLRMLKKRRVLAVLRALLGDMLPGAFSDGPCMLSDGVLALVRPESMALEGRASEVWLVEWGGELGMSML